MTFSVSLAFMTGSESQPVDTDSSSHLVSPLIFRSQRIWNAKLTETRIFRELSIEIESSLIELKSSLIEFKERFNPIRELFNSIIELSMYN